MGRIEKNNVILITAKAKLYLEFSVLKSSSIELQMCIQSFEMQKFRFEHSILKVFQYNSKIIAP